MVFASREGGSVDLGFALGLRDPPGPFVATPSAGNLSSLREVAEFLETQHTGLGCFPWFHSKCLVPLFSWPAPRCHFDLTGSREAWTLKSWRTHHPSITPLFPRERAHVSRVAVWRNMMCKRRCDTRESYSVSFSSGATPPSAQSCLNVNIWVILMWPKLPQRTYLQVGFPL